MTTSLGKWIRGWLSGQPHFIIGDRYLLRWYVLPRNPWLNVYLHKFLHDDEDRALHDHPWWFIVNGVLDTPFLGKALGICHLKLVGVILNGLGHRSCGSGHL